MNLLHEEQSRMLTPVTKKKKTTNLGNDEECDKNLNFNKYNHCLDKKFIEQEKNKKNVISGNDLHKL